MPISCTGSMPKDRSDETSIRTPRSRGPAGDEELGDDQGEAEPEEEEREVGVESAWRKPERAEALLVCTVAPVRSKDRLAAGDLDRPTVHLAEQRRAVARDQVDHAEPEGLLRRDALRLPDGRLGPIGVAAALLGDAADVFGGVVHGLLRRTIPRPPTGCAAPTFVAGAIAASWSKQDERARRGGSRALRRDTYDHGTSAFRIA